jgi:hypothetical protein
VQSFECKVQNEAGAGSVGLLERFQERFWKAFLAASVKWPGISIMFIFTIWTLKHETGKRCYD